MHAVRQHVHGGPEVLVLEDVADLEPGPDQVRVAVAAAGVHLLDASIRAGESFGSLPAPELPMTPGREVAGTVDAVGPGVDSTWVGRRVVAHLGAASGGYAEQALVAVTSLHPVPDGLSAELAVAAIGTGRTATGLLDVADVRPGEVVLVMSAAGGLGVLLVQGVANAGATAVGLAGGPVKTEVARRAGASAVVDYLDDAWPDQVRGLGLEPTLVLDAVGGRAGEQAYALLVPGGRLVRYGWTAGDARYDDPERDVVEPLGPTLLARGLRTLESEALAAAADGTRVPVVGGRFALGDAAEAHRALTGRRTFGKVVLVTKGGEA
ncbi:alcohol dehydrogenase catalytic domain-containing protein [Aeromicrobium massiliense]|uniref:alcohol dehydrogenase catalytic domain-containing protein n=1 Tax=Aeromicrobium massiliense TaxID=1464554 RepID=UPI0002F8BACB|nr:zinc-binding dehydrogenase [Aeromicrobium massiliense]